MTVAVDGLLSESSGQSRVNEARTSFVAEMVGLLEEAFLNDLLSFRTVRGMNFEEVIIDIPYDGFYIVLGRLDKKQEYRPYAATHTLRICNQAAEDAYWFEPFVLDDLVIGNGPLCDLRNKLAGLHRDFMSAEPKNKNNDKFLWQLFQQGRFLRRLKEAVGRP